MKHTFQVGCDHPDHRLMAEGYTESAQEDLEFANLPYGHARKKPLRGFLYIFLIYTFYTLGYLRGITEGIGTFFKQINDSIQSTRESRH